MFEETEEGEKNRGPLLLSAADKPVLTLEEQTEFHDKNLGSIKTKEREMVDINVSKNNFLILLKSVVIKCGVFNFTWCVSPTWPLGTVTQGTLAT